MRNVIIACNISPMLHETWADAETFPAPVCRRRRCSCYLAYGGRQEIVNEMLFGPWPLFRIPRHPRAVFLDIEGTLLRAGEMDGEHLLLLGGAGRAGAREHFYDLEDFRRKYLADLKRMEGAARCQVLCYEQEGRCYKITLLRPARRPWQRQEAESLLRALFQEETGESGGDKTGKGDDLRGMAAMEGGEKLSSDSACRSG